MMNYNNWDYGNGHGNGFAGFIVTLLMFLSVIIVIAIFVRYLGIHSVTLHHQNTALSLLDKRYARGEIDKKEYEEKRTDLGG